MSDLKNLNFLVIGASSGIGYETARQLIDAGANVYAASRQQPSLPLTHFVWDAATDTPSFVASLPEVLHGVVYAPGTINLKPFNRLSAEDFKQDFQINVLGAIAVLQACLPNLRKANGASVVLYSTVAAKIGMGFHASVAVSKGAVEGLAKSLAAEWAGASIRVNVIAPSLTDTPLAKILLNTPEKQEASNKRHPLGRYGTAQDVASATLFLLNPASAWVTGQVIGIDGGMGSLK